MIVISLIMVISGCSRSAVELTDVASDFVLDDGVIFSCPQDWILQGDGQGTARCIDNSVAPMMVFDASWGEGEIQLGAWKLENLEEISSTADTQDATFKGYAAKKIVMKEPVEDIEFIREVLTFNCNGKNVLIQKSYPTDLGDYTNLFDSIEESFKCEQ